MASIPNIFQGHTFLGQALAGLASQIMSGPSDAENYASADNALLLHRKVQGQDSLAARFRGFDTPSAPVGNSPGPLTSVAPAAPVAAPAPSGPNEASIADLIKSLGGAVTSGYRTPQHNADIGGAANSFHTQGDGQAADVTGVPEAALRAAIEQRGWPIAELMTEHAGDPHSTGDHVHYAWGGGGAPAPAFPIAQQAVAAPQPNTVAGVPWGEMASDALYAGVDPTKLGEYELNILANRDGARANSAVNAAVGAGKPYDGTAQGFDLKQADDITKANLTQAGDNFRNANTIAGEDRRSTASLANQAAIAAGHDAAKGAVDPNAVTFGVDYFLANGVLPPSARNAHLQNAIMAQVTTVLKRAGVTQDDITNKRLGIHARGQAANVLAKQGALTDVNEATVNGSMDILQGLLDKGAAGPTNMTSLNEVIQWGRRQGNNADAANLVNAISTVANEYARVMTGTTGGAAATDGARNEAAQRILLGYNQGTIEAVMGQMRQEMEVRSRAYASGLVKETGGALAPHDANSSPAPAKPGNLDDILKKYGH